MQVLSQGWCGVRQGGPCRITTSCTTYPRRRPLAVVGLRGAAGHGYIGSHPRGSSLGGRGKGNRWTAAHSPYVHPTETVDYEAGMPDVEPVGEAKDDDEVTEGGRWARIKAWIEEMQTSPEVRLCMQMAQFAASLLFVVLYVWSTYSAPRPCSLRYNLDIGLCFVFALDYMFRMLGADNKLRAVLSFWNLLDFLAVFPPLLEWGLHRPGFTMGRFDFRWFKILRALRVMRVSLLASEIRNVKLSSGALLSGAASIRLYQLVASVLSLLFTTSSIVVLVERIPFHDALYFVTTTLTTVGFGDVVAVSPIGKFAVLAMICVGVVLIPVQTSQLYSQLTARRVTLGSLSDGKAPTVLVSTQLTDVRGFADFYMEFFQALKKSNLPSTLRMVALCNRPNYEFRAFQEMHDQRLTLMEGSALSERDLQRSHAESVRACLLLANRFSTNARQEDISIQFQVWALKSYTKRVPLYVQVLLRSSQALIQPFLDPDHDVVVSVEQTRHRLLALSCLCPGASTLIANLLRRAAVCPTGVKRRTLAGRRWMRNYVNGCAHKVFSARLSPSLASVSFTEAAEWMHRTSGCILIGVSRRGKVVLNPGRRRLRGGEAAIIVGPSQREVDAAASGTFKPAARQFLAGFLDEDVGAGPPDGSPPDIGVELYVDGEVLCVPKEEMETPAIADSESIDYDSVPCILPELPLPPLQTDKQRRRSHAGPARRPMGAFLEGFSEPDTLGPLASCSYDSEDESDSENDDDDADERKGVLREEPDSGNDDDDEEPYFEVRQKLAENRPPRGRDAALRRYVKDPGEKGNEASAGPAGRGGVGEAEPGAGAGNGKHERGAPESAESGEMQGLRNGNGTVSRGELNGSHRAAEEGSESRRNGAHGHSQNGVALSKGGSEHAVGSGNNGAAEGQKDWGRDGAHDPGYVDDEEYFLSDTNRDARLLRPNGDLSREPEGVASDIASLSDHVILCGAEESFLPFVEELRRCDPSPTDIVVLHPRRPVESWMGLSAHGPLHYVKGEPSNGGSLKAARASHARGLVYLTGNQRPIRVRENSEDREAGSSEAPRAAVLADAQGLLTCYGVGEEGGAVLPHAVVELCYTSSVRFLQPGLLLKGVGLGDDASALERVMGPRKSWLMRKRQEMAAIKEGLSEWQANPYYCAGRVTVPAVMDTFACHCFFNRGMMTELLAELAGDDGMPGGALLRQISVPPQYVGRPYGDMVAKLALTQHLIAIGLYRRKSENKAWRLHYVVTNPPADERLEAGDRVFVIRERGEVVSPPYEAVSQTHW